ncbi:ribonuclease H [Trifolium pratense]|uniref:Ribonuclease H n=1 Tax=Trifolium pratense TaxID=57577 RepID=A0A2K3MTX7_TRIPR|nr:ribonuclease H [Trifolium pratense]
MQQQLIHCNIYHVAQHCEVPIYLDGARVCDLVDEDGRWNWQIFRDWMPSDIQGKIAAILLPSAVNGCDEQAGIGGNNKDFSVAAMYEHICGFDRRNAQLMWKKTWQLNVTEQVVPLEERNTFFMENLEQWIYSNLSKGAKGRTVGSPPCGNFVKLNTDGACKDQGRAGCGGIIRGSQGEWLGGFARGLGNCSAIVAELWGVAKGLSYARRLGFTAVELNVDSVVLVQAIKTGRFSSSVGLPLVKHIRRMLESDWEIKIEHAYKESNKCAYALANIGCHLDRETIFYDSCPIPIKELLLAE